MVTRKETREQERDANYFFEFAKIQRHFFKDLNDKLKNIKDPRHRSYITYDPDILLFMIVMKNACNFASMRGMTDGMNKEECIQNLKASLGVDALAELPHYDTINDFLAALDPSELRKIRTYMIRTLLQKRCFDDYRIHGKYWGIIIDGTGLFTFRQKHCDHCLKRNYTDQETGEEKPIYMHHVLEAKLVVGDMVLSLDSEFIENEDEDVTKQDCELNAFYRLARRVKNTFKKWPICILADSLYACEGVFDLCEQYRWKYLLRFKEGRIRSVMEEFQALKNIEGKDHPASEVEWVNDIAYHQHSLNVLACSLETKEGQKAFTFLTNIKVTKKNAQGLTSAGRSRWKIENQGFNRQKNIQYHIEHASSRDYTAMKNHYLLTQITDILMQLFEKGSKLVKGRNKTVKEISSGLLEALRTKLLTGEDISRLVNPIQVRFT